MWDKLKESCGVLGIYNEKEDPGISKKVYYGLFALQHRGQESAGIAATSGDNINYHKGLGLVSEVFDDDVLNKLKGNIAIGHVRYATSGTNTLANAQPLVVRYKKGSLAVCHNGNLVNAYSLREKLENDGAVFQTTVDSEIIAFLMARENQGNLLQAAKTCMEKLRGSFAVVMMTEDSLIGMRDPKGIRPLCLGKMGKSYLIASESCAFDTIGAEFVRDIKPGEIVVIDRDGIKSTKVKQEKVSHCIFEFVYFARPDSTIDGKNVYISRWKAGKQLAKEHPVDADLVIGVPDSGNVSAMGYSESSGIPSAIGLIKNKYVGRTFIEPDQESRMLGVRLKLNVMKEVICGKRIIMVDDSIVRGTTSSQIVKMLRDAGAKEVHVRISSPPIMHSCYFGIDTSTRKELIGAQQEIDEICDYIGADSLGYLSIEGLIKSTSIARDRFCLGCFLGEYPIDVPMEHKKYLFEKC